MFLSSSSQRNLHDILHEVNIISLSERGLVRLASFSFATPLSFAHLAKAMNRRSDVRQLSSALVYVCVSLVKANQVDRHFSLPFHFKC
jgi:hypothetical protein